MYIYTVCFQLKIKRPSEVFFFFCQIHTWVFPLLCISIDLNIYTLFRQDRNSTHFGIVYDDVTTCPSHLRLINTCHKSNMLKAGGKHRIKQVCTMPPVLREQKKCLINFFNFSLDFID